MMYVVMDGFDLGIGILFPFMPETRDRNVMMNTIAPVWDGNETWLVMGGAGLLAGFPMAYSIILTAFYLPLTLMLVGLIFRGVAFEFRFKVAADRQYIWDYAFAGGSCMAAFFQGATLGAFVQGVPVVNNAYAGAAFDWISPFSVFTGLGLVVTYALLGSTWLIMKTEGPLHTRMRELAHYLILGLLAVIAVISIWTPLADPNIAKRWFSFPNLLWFSPVPVLVALSSFFLLRALRSDAHVMPFVLTLVLVFLGYSGLGISLWPNIIPPSISIQAAAAPPQSMGFALVGALLIIPVILMYTIWNYWVFAGKVREGESYH
jgi:cytochrome bd ubiquinol oxidase subunit II